MVFVYTRSWEFAAEDYEEAKKIASSINPYLIGDIIQTEEKLFVSEDSLESHWEKYGAK